MCPSPLNQYVSISFSSSSCTTSFSIYPSFLLSHLASSLASVIPHGLIIISKRDSGLLHSFLEMMCILSESGPGCFIDATGKDTVHWQSGQSGAHRYMMVPGLISMTKRDLSSFIHKTVNDMSICIFTLKGAVPRWRVRHYSLDYMFGCVFLTFSLHLMRWLTKRYF